MYFIAFAILIIVIVVFLRYKYIFTTSPTKSTINESEYNVVASYADKVKAADLMAELDNFSKEFVRKMDEKYGKSSGRKREYANNLLKRWKGGKTLSENVPAYGDDTSYTINKGQHISLCLREQIEPYALHEIGVLKYVFLHELTHVAMTGADPRHSPNFWGVFKGILTDADSFGLYQPENYKNNPKTYCGLKLDYNPYFDTRIPTGTVEGFWN